MSQWWTVSPEWPGETVFVVAGGPSVADQDTDALRGRRVIALNSSWQRVPFADLVFFADDRWWREYSKEVLAWYRGRIATCAPDVSHERFLKLKRKPVFEGLSTDRSEVMVRRTSLTGAINLAVHLGAAALVLLGVDGKPGVDGRVHHHAEYPQALAYHGGRDPWIEQRKDIESVASDLKRLGIPVLNASPGSAYADLWPTMTLKEAIERVDGIAADSDPGNAWPRGQSASAGADAPADARS